MAATGVDRDSRVDNRQWQKDFGDYRKKTDEKLGSLQAGQQSLEAKLDAMMAILQSGKSNSAEERNRVEAQDSQIQPPGVPISQEDTIPPTNLQAPILQESFNSQIQPPGIPVRQGAITSAVVPANSQVRPQEIVSQQHQFLAQTHRFAPVISPTNLQVPTPQEVVKSQQQFLAESHQFAPQMQQPVQFPQQQWQFVPQFQKNHNFGSYPDPYLHPDTGDGCGYPRTHFEPITRYQQQNYYNSYSSYGQFSDCTVDFPSYDGLNSLRNHDADVVNSLRNHDGLGSDLRNLDFCKNLAECVDINLETIVFEEMNGTNMSAEKKPQSVLGDNDDEDAPEYEAVEVQVKEELWDTEFSKQQRVEGNCNMEENEEMKGSGSEFLECGYVMDDNQEGDVEVDKLFFLEDEASNSLSGVGNSSLEIDLTFEGKEDKVLDYEEKPYTDLQAIGEKELAVHCSIKRVEMQDQNVGNGDVSASDFSNVSRIIELIFLETCVVVGRYCCEYHESHMMLVIGFLQLIEGTVLWDYKRYKKRVKSLVLRSLAVLGGKDNSERQGNNNLCLKTLRFYNISLFTCWAELQACENGLLSTIAKDKLLFCKAYSPREGYVEYHELRLAGLMLEFSKEKLLNLKGSALIPFSFRICSLSCICLFQLVILEVKDFQGLGNVISVK